jgi:hypothetical protein
MPYNEFGQFVPDDTLSVNDMRHELLAKNKTPQFMQNLEALYQLLPQNLITRNVKPLTETTATVGSGLAAPFLGIANAIGQNAINGNARGPVKRADSPEFAEPFIYQPRTEGGQELVGSIMKGLEASKLPPFIAGGMGRFRFTPDDLRVAGKTAVSDVRNFPTDYANARAGFQREYPTLGSTAAGGMRTAETANQALNKAILFPSDVAVQKITGNPLATSTGVVNELSQFNPLAQAMKPKGGNWPTTLGSSLPLEEQGRIGMYLAESTAGPNRPLMVWNQKIRDLGYLPEWVDYLKLNNASDIPSTDPRYPLLAKQFTELINNHIAANGPNAVGGQPMQFIKPLEEIQAMTDAYNKWILEGPHKKYLTTQFGTGVETDPVLKAVEEANIDPFNLRRERDATRERTSAKEDIRYLKEKYDSALQYFQRHPDRPDIFPNPEPILFNPDMNQLANVGKLTSRTPAGQKFENAQDYVLNDYSNTYHPKYSTDDVRANFPISSKLKIGTPIYDVVASSMLDDVGMSQIKQHLLDKVMSGEISPEKLPSVSVESVVRDMIKTQQDRLRKAEKDKSLYLDWRSQNHNTLPADVAFTDADGNPTGAKMVVFNADMADANPDLVIRNLSQDTKELNHCVGSCGHGTPDYPNRHVPMVEPHTGTAPKGSDASYGPNYIKRIKNGEIEIASLRGPNGESKATLQLNPDVNKDGDVVYRIEQIKGKGNGKLQPEDVDLVKNWLNSKGSAIRDNRISDLDNLPGVFDMRNTQAYEIADVHQTIHSDKLGDFLNSLVHKKINNNPELEEYYNSGYLHPMDLIKEDLPRFVTVDDLKQVAEKNGFDIERRPEDTKTTGAKTNGLNDMDRLILEMEINTFFENQRLPDDFADYLPDYQRDVTILLGDQNPDAKLPAEAHKSLSNALIHQEEHRVNLEQSMRSLRVDPTLGGWTEAQSRNALNIIEQWLQAHPFE